MVVGKSYLEKQSRGSILQGNRNEASRMDGRLDAASNLTYLSITYNKRIDEIKRAIEHHLVNHSELNEKTKGGVQISSVTEIEASFFVARLCAFKAARNSILPRIFAFLFINTILGGIMST